jgi:hypothetical protein
VSAKGERDYEKSQLEKIEESYKKKRLENFIKMLKIRGKDSNQENIFAEIEKET